MDAETLQAFSSFAENVTSLALALGFLFYLTKQVARRDDLIFNDWQRQREIERAESAE